MVKEKKISNQISKRTISESCVGGLIPRYDPEISFNGLGCYTLKNGASDPLNGLGLLNHPGLNFSDPFIDNTLMDPGYCIKNH